MPRVISKHPMFMWQIRSTDTEIRAEVRVLLFTMQSWFTEFNINYHRKSLFPKHSSSSTLQKNVGNCIPCSFGCLWMVDKSDRGLVYFPVVICCILYHKQFYEISCWKHFDKHCFDTFLKWWTEQEHRMTAMSKSEEQNKHFGIYWRSGQLHSHTCETHERVRYSWIRLHNHCSAHK